MASHWLPLLLLSSSFLLAGCADDSDTRMDTPSESMNSLAVVSTEEAPPAPPALEPVTVVCDVVRTQAGTSLGFGLFLDRAVLDDPGCYLADLFGGDLDKAASVLVEAEWAPQPSMTGANAWFEASDCQSTPLEPCGLPSAQSTSSPLRMTLEGDAFAAHAGSELGLQVAAQGVVVQQAFKVHLTLFEAPAVPADFSALA